MKTKKLEKNKNKLTSIMVPAELNLEFRQVCEEKAFMANKIIQMLLRSWIDTEKKKQNYSLVANG